MAKSGDTVSQAFIAQQDYLSGFSLCMGTLSRNNSCTVRIRLDRIRTPSNAMSGHPDLRHDACTLVRELILDARQLYDNDWVDLAFDPIPESANQCFLLTLTCDDSEPGNAVSVWTDTHLASRPGFLFVELDTDGSSTDETALAMIPRYSPAIVPDPTPRGIGFSPVTQCNLNCVHCISKSTRRHRSVLPEKLAAAIKGYVDRKFIERISGDYSGDLFFADEKYGGWLDYMISLGVPFHVDTNGTHITLDRVRKLSASNVQSINISLDASTKETYRRIRKGSIPLEEVIQNAELLSRALKEAGRSDISLSFGFTLMRSNIHEIIGLIDIGSRAGIPAIYTMHLGVFDPNLNSESLADHAELFNSWRSKALQAAAERGIQLNLPPAFDIGKNDASGHKYCREPWYSALILGNGDVMACCVPGTKMGNLSESSLEEIWNGSEYRQLRRLVNTPDEPLICASCPIYRLPHNRASYVHQEATNRSSEPGAWVQDRAANGQRDFVQVFPSRALPGAGAKHG